MTAASKLVNGYVLTHRDAYVLEMGLDLTSHRTRLRGSDPELDQLLNDIRLIAMQWTAYVNGSQQRKPTEAKPDSKQWYTPADLAGKTNVTEHAIRLAIREGRLHSTLVNRRHHIAPVEYERYLAKHHSRR